LKGPGPPNRWPGPPRNIIPAKSGRSSSSDSLPSPFLSSFFNAAAAFSISSAEITPSPLASSDFISGSIRNN
jgi:hypothetical protein